MLTLTVPKPFYLLSPKKAHSRTNKLHLALHVYLLFIHSEMRCRSHHPGKIPEGIAQQKRVMGKKGNGPIHFVSFLAHDEPLRRDVLVAP